MRKIRGCKRGMSHHIEMMISFVLFIMFVFFVLIFLRPQDNNYLSGSVVEGAFYNFREEARIDTMVMFVDVNDSSSIPGSCFQLALPVELIGTEDAMPITITEHGDYRDSQVLFSTDQLIVSESDNKNHSYYVYMSPEFSVLNAVSCGAPRVISNPRIGSFRKEKVISYTQMQLMRREYLSDYDALRERLGIPEVFDFAIVVGDGLEMQKQIPAGVNVMARDYIEKVIYDDGQVKYERISFRIWR